MTVLYVKKIIRTSLLFVLSLFLYAIGKEDFKFNVISDKNIFGSCVTGILIMIIKGKISVENIICGFITITLFFVISVIFIPGSFGGGDVKLFMCSSLFLGMNVWKVFVITFFCAFPFAFFNIVKGKKEKHIPVGPYISFGIFIESLLFLYGLT